MFLCAVSVTGLTPRGGAAPSLSPLHLVDVSPRPMFVSLLSVAAGGLEQVGEGAGGCMVPGHNGADCQGRGDKKMEASAGKVAETRKRSRNIA